jgi:hypothetical protein
MKFGLFFAFLVLLASTNVFGQQGGRTRERKDRLNRIKTDGLDAGQDTRIDTGSDNVIKGTQRDSQPVTATDVIHNENKPITQVQDESKPGTEEVDRRPEDYDEAHENVNPDIVQVDHKPQGPIKGSPADENQLDGNSTSAEDVKDREPISVVCIKTFSFIYIFFNFRLTQYLKSLFMLVVTLFSSNIVHQLLIPFNMILMVHIQQMVLVVKPFNLVYPMLKILLLVKVV